MKKISVMKLFQKWVKEKVIIILFFLLIFILCLIVNFLYDRNMTPVLYSLYMSLFIGIVFLLYDFIHYLRRYHKIIEGLKKLETSILEFPDNSTFLEECYQEIAFILNDEKIDLKSKMQLDAKENNEYYTMWVHQIKTPIAAIRLLLQSFEKSEKVRLIEQEMLKIEQYAQMALQYASLQANNSDYVFKECSLYEIVKKAVKKNSILFIEKNLSLEFEPFDAKITTDEKWVEILLEQLLSNAVKYTNKGGIKIICTKESNIAVPDHKENTTNDSNSNNCQIKENDAEDFSIKLELTDSGIGIKEEDIPRIFEKGYTGINGHIDEKSTGIGLYLCRQIADKLGIRLSVKSTIGKGSSFYLEFPLEKYESDK